MQTRLLTEKAVEIEKMISVKQHERKRQEFDPTMFKEKLFLESETGWQTN